MKLSKNAFLCIILCLTMIMSLSSNIFAVGITTATENADQYVLQCLPDLLSHLSNNTGRYGLNNPDLSNISVSSAFTVSGSRDNATYYALMSNAKVLGIITVSYTDGKYSLSYAKDFADLLTTLHASNTPFSLSWNYHDNNSASLSVQSASSTISSVSSSLAKKLVTGSSSYTMSSTRILNDSGELTNTFPLIHQDYSTYGFSCSVACAKAMSQYFNSSLSTKTLGDVIDEVYGWEQIPSAPYFLPLERAPEVFDEYVSNSYLTFGYALSLQGTKNQINSNNPTMCISESPDYEYSYHATVITGYSYGSASGSYMIDMMDPYTPSWRIVFWDGVDELTYSFNGYEKVWRKTIVLYS